MANTSENLSFIKIRIETNASRVMYPKVSLSSLEICVAYKYCRVCDHSRTYC